MSMLTDDSQEHRTFTARATLVAIGIKVRRLGLLQPIFQKVRIAQKTVKFSPAEKLVDALITLFAGAHGLVEANKRVRPDGVVVFHSSGIVQIVLNRGDSVARELGPGLAALLAPEETAIILGEI